MFAGALVELGDDCSAMGVAERVAIERGEPIGGTVGYTIRLESKSSAMTQMLFCTTGILPTPNRSLSLSPNSLLRVVLHSSE